MKPKQCFAFLFAIGKSSSTRGQCEGKDQLQLSIHLMISGFLALLTTGGGPSVSGYGNLGLPFDLPAGRSGIVVSGSLMGVFGGRGGAIVGGDEFL